MKTRPILFGGEMVRAILEGRKTQTRRVIKPQPPVDMDYVLADRFGLASWHYGDPEDECWPEENVLPCRYGKPGNLLWVRETWAVNAHYDPRKPSELSDGLLSLDLRYAADWALGSKPRYLGKTRPSIFMPRWASRITLEVVGVRVERVQEISKDDVIEEGITSYTTNFGPKSNPRQIYPAFPERDGGFLTAAQAFEALWDSINAKRGYSFESNPWVWVVDFRMVKEPLR